MGADLGRSELKYERCDTANLEYRCQTDPAQASVELQWKMTGANRLLQNVRKYVTIDHHARDDQTFVSSPLTLRQSQNDCTRRFAVDSGVKGPAIPRTDFSTWPDCDWQYTKKTSSGLKERLSSSSG